MIPAFVAVFNTAALAYILWLERKAVLRERRRQTGRQQATTQTNTRSVDN